MTFLLAALSLLSSHVTQLVETGMPYADAIGFMVDEIDKEAEWGTNKEQVKERFTTLLNPEIHQRFRKLQRLQSGFIPNAVGFSTLVDLRPDFGTSKELELKGYLPIVQFRVTTDSPNPAEKRLVFQVSEEALGELKKALERAESKLAMLKAQPAIALQILKL